MQNNNEKQDNPKDKKKKQNNKVTYEPPKLKKFEKLQKLIVSGE